MINNKKHIKNLLIWLHNECCSACGDGDAWWKVSKFYELADILELVKEVNETELGLFRWEIEFDEKDQSISWGQDQEWVIIFKGEDPNNIPSWAQCVITL